jgi:hypothetical protein
VERFRLEGQKGTLSRMVNAEVKGRELVGTIPH